MSTPRTAIRLSRQEGRMFLGTAPKRQSRYTAVSKERRTVDGHVFASLAECTRYGQLKLRELLGEISDIRMQTQFECVVNGALILKYKVDFDYLENGARRYEEVKSWNSGKEKDWRLRRKLVEALHGVKIDVVSI